MGLSTPKTVRKLQTALHAKAKEAPDYRFYALYDKIYRKDVLHFAYRLALSKGGAPGVDGQSFEEIEAQGREPWLDALAEELRTKTYRAEAVRRVYIPKPNGKKRPLGIATIKDRVAQTAALLMLQPIFEADLQPEQYAYRTGRSALDAVGEVNRLVNYGFKEVVDADLSGYFDTIPHPELMKCLSRRISDGSLLHLIKMWLQAPVEETDERGHTRRTTQSKDERCGMPQGAPISPLLSNLYMRRFILAWKVLGYEKRLKAHIVNYADDLVLCCRRDAEEALKAMRAIMERLKLTVNEEKTRVCRVPEESFDFLGYTIGRLYSVQTGKAYIGTQPSRKQIQRLCRQISERTSRRWTPEGVQEKVEEINRLLMGWSNYFYLGSVSKAYRAVDRHTHRRLRRWLCKKHKVQGGGTTRYPFKYLYEDLGLVQLESRTRSFPWAKA
jgi:RNA-directed DNA polymerase